MWTDHILSADRSGVPFRDPFYFHLIYPNAVPFEPFRWWTMDSSSVGQFSKLLLHISLFTMGNVRIFYPPPRPSAQTFANQTRQGSHHITNCVNARLNWGKGWMSSQCVSSYCPACHSTVGLPALDDGFLDRRADPCTLLWIYYFLSSNGN